VTLSAELAMTRGCSSRAFNTSGVLTDLFSTAIIPAPKGTEIVNLPTHGRPAQKAELEKRVAGPVQSDVPVGSTVQRASSKPTKTAAIPSSRRPPRGRE
jgi:hypothetical protein